MTWLQLIVLVISLSIVIVLSAQAAISTVWRGLLELGVRLDRIHSSMEALEKSGNEIERHTSQIAKPIRDAERWDPYDA